MSAWSRDERKVVKYLRKRCRSGEIVCTKGDVIGTVPSADAKYSTIMERLQTLGAITQVKDDHKGKARSFRITPEILNLQTRPNKLKALTEHMSGYSILAFIAFLFLIAVAIFSGFNEIRDFFDNNHGNAATSNDANAPSSAPPPRRVDPAGNIP